MNRVVSYSGGLGSFMAAYRVVQQHGPANVTLLFTDTKTEDEDLYRFISDTEQYFGINVTKIADGRDVWQVFNDVRFMGNSRIDPCSRILKRELAKKWMKENAPPESTALYFGIGWNEVNRMDAIRKNWSPYAVHAPLTEKPYVERDDIIALLEKIGIKPPRLYALGFAHNNCGGFCIKTGQAQFLKLLKTMPERYKEHEDKQEELFKKIPPHGFIRVTKNKKLHYLTLKQFREYAESNGQIDMFDVGGCGCFV